MQAKFCLGNAKRRNHLGGGEEVDRGKAGEGADWLKMASDMVQ